VFNKDFVAKRASDIKKLVDAWFDTLAYIKANPAETQAIMAKRAGVSTADYATYDKGTTIFSLDQNVEAFTPGSTSKNLDFEASEISKFLLDNKLIDKAPNLQGLFDATYVKAKAAKP
jgi:NitT/TauT family transport system substrate-binding protein